MSTSRQLHEYKKPGSGRTCPACGNTLGIPLSMYEDEWQVRCVFVVAEESALRPCLRLTCSVCGHAMFSECWDEDGARNGF